jgi:hypothetical protein
MTRNLVTAVLALLLIAAPAAADPGDIVVDYGDGGTVTVPPESPGLDCLVLVVPGGKDRIDGF